MNEKETFELHTPERFNDAKLVGVFETGSEEWHAARELGIGGSEIGTIMGLNPWESAFALWAKRTGQIPNPPIDNWSVRFGKAFEEPILRMWAEQNPQWTVYLTGTYQHASKGYLIANPDALARNKDTGEWILIEVKTARSGWTITPPAYVAQVQHYLNVLHLDRGIIVAVAGWSWEERPVERDSFFIEALETAADRFWDHLQEMVMPEWDGAKTTYEAVRQLNPELTDDEVDLGELGIELLDAQEVFDEAERDLLLVKSKVLNKMGQAKHGMVTVDGETKRVAARQARGQGTPWLVVKRD